MDLVILSLFSRDGRLERGDQILRINDVDLDHDVSHQKAIELLQKSRGTVKLRVAKGTMPGSALSSRSTSRSPEPTSGGGVVKVDRASSVTKKAITFFSL